MASWMMAVLVAPSSAVADFGFEELGFSFVEPGGSGAQQAGSHPFAVVNRFSFKTRIDPRYGEVPDGAVKDLNVKLPAGLVGAPDSTPRCSSADFSDFDLETYLPKCSDGSAIGVVSLRILLSLGAAPEFITAPVYNLVSPPGIVQKLGFIAHGVPVAIPFTVNQAPPHNILISLSNLSQALPIYGARLIIWGNPPSPLHDSERGSCIDAAVTSEVERIATTGESCAADLAEAPFLTLPRSCASPPEAGFEVSSWPQPDAFISRNVFADDGGTAARRVELTGCGKLGFAPVIVVQPTNGAVQSPTGLVFSFAMDNEGLTSPSGVAQSDVEKGTVAFPKGMSVNASAAAGLGACTRADFSRETLTAAPNKGCPNSSKIGTAEVVSPLLGEPLKGSLFVAQPDDPFTSVQGIENPFDSLLAIYIAVRNPNLGIIIKQAAKVTLDPRTGQLTTTLDDLPQVPFSDFKLRFREGERAPLTTPSSCGTYTAEADLVPRSQPGSVLRTASSFQITTGLHRAPCPIDDRQLSFKPALQAGTLAANAGTYSPLFLKVSREEGTQPLGAIRARLPAGLLGRLAGILLCSEAEISAAVHASGRAEQRMSSCPAASAVGTVITGAGAGAIPLYLQGHAYLAGAYKGAPLSLAVVTPATAGPFDLGTVVVRIALRFDPETTRVNAMSDSIPTIASGVPLNIRSIAINLSRPNFVLNPTSCETTQFSGGAISASGENVPLAERFRVGACRSLDFRPRLSLRLLGPTHRSAHPPLRVAMRTREGDANVRRLALKLPGTELLESRHIGAVCGTEQFAARTCPKDSIYGHAKAWSTLLEKPLQGPVFLRSSSRRLPDLVASLDGPFHVDLEGHIDSARGRLRTTFNSLPDIPIRRFVLSMRGGRKGLFVNTQGLCGGVLRAGVKVDAQSGKSRETNPVVKTYCGKGRKPGR